MLDELDTAMLNNDGKRVEQTAAQFLVQFPGARHVVLINKIIESFMKVARTDRAKNFFMSVVRSGFRPDARTIEVLIDGYLRHGEVEHAQEVMKGMDAFEIKPTIKIMNRWIHHFLEDQQIEKARALFSAFDAEGLQPSVVTFLNFIRYFMRNSDFGAAHKVKLYMRERGVKPTTPYYNAILQLLFKKQALAEVEDTLIEMDTEGVAADENTFNVLIEGYSSVNMLEKAQELIKKMLEIGMKPSIMTFNRLLSSQAFALDVEQTKEILVQMNDLGLEFNAYTYAALFKGLIAKQRYQEGIMMLFRMEESGIAVPVAVMSQLVKLCCDSNLDSAVYLLRTCMVKHELSTNTHIYNVLLKYYLRHRDYKQVDGLLLEMQRTKHIRVDLHIFATLLNHYVEHLDIDRIKKTLQEIKARKMELNGVVYNIVMKAFYVHCKCLDGGLVYRTELGPASTDASHVALLEPASKRTSITKIKQDFEQTFGIPFRPSVHIFNDLMNNFFYSGRYIETLECFQEILSCDLLPNLSTMTTLIKTRLYLGQLHEAKEVIHTLPRYGLQPSILQCALLHHSLCRDLKTEEAEEFMQEITSVYHVKINYVFLASLIYAYSRRFDHYNVFRTFERLLAAKFKPDTEACNYVLISMFEVGQFEEAHDFFAKMVAQDIRRNHYTYSIMADPHTVKTEPDRLMVYLADSLLPGNTIDAYPFNKLMRSFYDKSQISRLSLLMEKMMECCVRFNWDTWQYVAYLFYRALDSTKDLEYARRLLEKALIDYDPNDELDLGMVNALKEAYQQDGDLVTLRSFERFLARLPELREKITQISPDLRDGIVDMETRKEERRFNRYTQPASRGEDPEARAVAGALQGELNSLAAHLDGRAEG